MPDDGERFIRRDAWGSRFDKGWWLGGTLFYGSPCLALMVGGALGGSVVAVAIAVVALIGLAIVNWRIRARQEGRLLVEITAEGIQMDNGRPMLPWNEVARVDGAWVGGFGAVAPSRALVLHLVDGGRVQHVFDGVEIDGIHDEVRAAIRRLAPAIPVSDDEARPPPGPR